MHFQGPLKLIIKDNEDEIKKILIVSKYSAILDCYAEGITATLDDAHDNSPPSAKPKKTKVLSCDSGRW